MDHAAGPQPDHGPRRTGRPDDVHDPRPGLELHRRVPAPSSDTAALASPP
jgi:hypothetical protein